MKLALNRTPKSERSDLEQNLRDNAAKCVIEARKAKRLGYIESFNFNFGCAYGYALSATKVALGCWSAERKG